MKAKMQADVERLAKLPENHLQGLVRVSGQRIKHYQHIHAAALKAQRLQRKGRE